MDLRKLSADVSVSPQIALADVAAIKAAGFRSIVCHRPDGEAADQPAFSEIEAAARAAGLEIRHQPIVSGGMTDADGHAFKALMDELPKPLLAYCRSGTRCTNVWALAEGGSRPFAEISGAAKAAGYDVSGLAQRFSDAAQKPATKPGLSHDVVIVGGGAAGVACASSLLRRRPDLDIAIIEPADTHYYQPGWTMVGAGVFEASTTANPMSAIMPPKATWIKAAVATFEPKSDAVVLADGRRVAYKRLIVCPGLKLDWAGVEGLGDTLGRNGVTSNYRFDLAPYTWQLVQSLKSGRAIFTQPPMPIKCAGAPQKAMYLSADHWRRNGRLKDIDIHFCNAGGVLFGVAAYVPALMEYVKLYDAKLDFHHNLVAIDGPARKAWFNRAVPNEPASKVEVDFDMIHVVPPQLAPDFVRASPLADAAGWVDVDQGTLRHKTYANIWALGDVGSTPNAKTAAAARKQAPIVAENVLIDMGGRPGRAVYDGYGSCPLTVERGKIVLAEFGYGGKLLPSFPSYVINGMKPSRRAWLLKERILPPVYWKAMLKGREWLAKPKVG